MRWRSLASSAAAAIPAPRGAPSRCRSTRPASSCWRSASASWRGPMLGVVNLDKPVGPTSHDMVALMRRLTGTRRIGHAGTLDPLASGVLPILVGAATRFSEELTAGRKRYEAVIRLGWRSATDDAEGPIEPGSAPPGAEVAVAALSDFIGTFAQRPPAFSARKIGGRTAHRAARAGTPVDLPARTVTVESLDLLAVEGGPEWLDLRVDLRCGPGTYVRSIARDLGDALGCGGYLAALRRTEAAGLRADDGLRPDRRAAVAATARDRRSGGGSVPPWRRRAHRRRHLRRRPPRRLRRPAARGRRDVGGGPAAAGQGHRRGDAMNGIGAFPIDRLPKVGAAAVSMGVFDGVHRGHLALVRATAAAAAEHGVASVALVFDPHPDEVVSPGTIVPRLAPMIDNLRRLELAGIDRALPVRFDAE